MVSGSLVSLVSVVPGLSGLGGLWSLVSLVPGPLGLCGPWRGVGRSAGDRTVTSRGGWGRPPAAQSAPDE